MSDKLKDFRADDDAPLLESEIAQRALMDMSQDTRELFEQAALGIEIESWLKNNPVGQYFAHLAEIERASALDDLVRALDEDPANTKEIKKHHRRIGLCDLFRSWLVDGVSVGREAARQLREQETTSPT